MNYSSDDHAAIERRSERLQLLSRNLENVRRLERRRDVAVFIATVLTLLTVLFVAFAS
jgi:type IV secretory pathway component VirB8